MASSHQVIWVAIGWLGGLYESYSSVSWPLARGDYMGRGEIAADRLHANSQGLGQ